jgi:hypothetical protein
LDSLVLVPKWKRLLISHEFSGTSAASETPLGFLFVLKKKRLIADLVWIFRNPLYLCLQSLKRILRPFHKSYDDFSLNFKLTSC